MLSVSWYWEVCCYLGRGWAVRHAWRKRLTLAWIRVRAYQTCSTSGTLEHNGGNGRALNRANRRRQWGPLCGLLRSPSPEQWIDRWRVHRFHNRRFRSRLSNIRPWQLRHRLPRRRANCRPVSRRRSRLRHRLFRWPTRRWRANRRLLRETRRVDDSVLGQGFRKGHRLESPARCTTNRPDGPSSLAWNHHAWPSR
jgi:hypothetical protein